MSKNNTVYSYDLVEWMEKNQEIQSHQAWHPELTVEKSSEALLANKDPYTFILRQGSDIEESNRYYISFVKADRSIKHQFFDLEEDKGGWLYRNGGTAFREIISNNLNDLITRIMDCGSKDCKPLARN